MSLDSQNVILTKQERRIQRKQQKRAKQQKAIPIVDFLRLQKIQPLTNNQRLFFDYYDDENEFILAIGSAGTGKSFVAIYKALEEIFREDAVYKKLVIVRSTVPSRDQGFLPGDAKKKNEEYEAAYKQIIFELFGKDVYNNLVGAGKLEFKSTSYLRSLTLNDSIVVADEIQNMNWEELLTVVTRLGDNSRFIGCGDYRQNDLYRKDSDKSGLEKFIDIAERMHAPIVEYTTNDIVRSDLVKRFLIAVEDYEDD